MKPLFAALAVLFVLLQYQLWFSDGGIVSIHRLNQSIQKRQQANVKLIERNHTLAADVRDLKKGNDAIAERARNDLGMVKKGEVFYQVVPNSKDTSRS